VNLDTGVSATAQVIAGKTGLGSYSEYGCQSVGKQNYLVPDSRRAVYCARLLLDPSQSSLFVGSHSDKWLSLYFCCQSWMTDISLPMKAAVIQSQYSTHFVRYLRKLYNERTMSHVSGLRNHCSDFDGMWC
jgi:hypothetical protein